MADLTNAVIAKYVRGLEDQLLRENALLRALKSKGRIKPFEGGSEIKLDVAVTEHASVTQLTSGYEPVDVTARSISEQASFGIAMPVAPVSVTDRERLLNANAAQRIFGILEERLRAQTNKLAKSIEDRIIGDPSSTGFSVLTDLETFNGASASDGWFSPSAFGSQSNTVGGIAQASYTDSWQHHLADVGSAFATNGEKAIRKAMIEAQTYGRLPDLLLLSTNAYNLLKESVRAEERFLKLSEDDPGRAVAIFMGAEVIACRSFGYTVGSNAYSGVALDSEAVTFYTLRGGRRLGRDEYGLVRLASSDPARPPDQLVEVRHLIVAGQIVINRLNTSALIINAES